MPAGSGGLMKKLALALLLLSLEAASAHGAVEIVLNVNGFTCTTTTSSQVTPGLGLSSWTWGAATPMQGTNGVKISPGGNPSLAMLMMNKAMDKCSAGLLALNLSSKLLSTVTVT